MKTAEELKALSIKEFNKAASKYESDFAGIYEMCKQDYPPILEEVRKDTFDTLLDAGCGTAPMLSMLVEEYPDVKFTGIDLAPGMIAKAQEKNLPNTQLVVGDCENLPFDDASFDVVINSQSFHHYPDPQAFFNSVARVLRPGGKLVLRDNTTGNKVLGWLMNNVEMPLAHAVGHGDVKVHTLDEVRSYCNVAGLAVEKLEQQKGFRLHLVARKPDGRQEQVNDTGNTESDLFKTTSSNDSVLTSEATTDNTEVSDNKAFWNRFAFAYGPFMAKNSKAYDAVCDHLRPAITKDMRVLELACGTGQFAKRLANEAGEWIATDFSEQMVRRIDQRAIPGVTNCEVADATVLPYENASFDCVVIANALHVMPDADAVLREIHRILRPNGLLMAPTFVYEGDIHEGGLKLVESIGFKTYHYWNCDEYASYVAERGFEIASSTLFPGNPAGECALVAIAL